MVRVTRPSRSSMRSVWVSIFWLTPAIVRDSSLYLRGASASAVRTSVTHLSLRASSTWRDGHSATYALYAARSCSRRRAAVVVAIALLDTSYALLGAFFPKESNKPSVGLWRVPDAARRGRSHGRRRSPSRGGSHGRGRSHESGHHPRLWRPGCHRASRRPGPAARDRAGTHPGAGGTGPPGRHRHPRWPSRRARPDGGQR